MAKKKKSEVFNLIIDKDRHIIMNQLYRGLTENPKIVDDIVGMVGLDVMQKFTEEIYEKVHERGWCDADNCGHGDTDMDD